MASLISKASLLMVPSTYEPGTLFNVLPSGNRAPDSTDQNSGYDQTRADFDFDRGSNAAATRIGSDGLLKKYRENVLTESNNFSDSDWTKSNVTLTSSQADKDGGTDAWKIEKDANSYRSIFQSLSISGVYTFSVYAKAGTLSELTLRDGSTQRSRFNLSSGTIIENVGSVTSKMTDVGGGWYRCEAVLTTSTPNFQIYPDWNQSDAGFIYIQDAQTETGLCSTEYLNSTDVTGKAGVLVDLPRINYDANGENGALLLEPSRKNVVTNSEYVSSSDYVVGNWTGTITTNTTETLSPEGVYNATKFVKAGASDRVYFHNSQPDGAYTGSIYLKAASGSENKTIEISVRRFGGGGGATTKLVTITSEWQRFDVTATNLTGGTTTAMYISDFSSAGTATEFYSYAMQIEAASYSSSYIPNHGTSGGVTRAADVCNNGGSAESINSTEGVLYAEIAALVNGGENRVMSISDGSYQNSVRIQFYTNTNEIEMRIVTGNSPQALERVAITNTLNFNKIAVKYKANDFQLWVNGSKLRFDTSGTMPAANTFDTFNFDDGDGNGVFYGNVKQVAVFNEALTDSELATLTTL